MAHADTDRIAAGGNRDLGAEPLPGYRLLALLGRGGSGEVWKCEAPGGLLKAIKFIHGGQGLDGRDALAEEELAAIERIKTIRHPFLLSLERVERLGGDLVVVLELADRNLGDVLDEERDAGKTGVPRDRLLGYLREAAEALDLLNLEYDLQHLDVKPQNLFLVGDHVKLGDFGLVQSLRGARPGQPTALPPGAITPTYAAPELFLNTVSRQSDQYSLAIVYQELLTGQRPFNGTNVRQLLLQHAQGDPDLSPLPEADRAAVARALSKAPGDRFSSCAAFVATLTASDSGLGTRSAELKALRTPSSELRGRDARPFDWGRESLDDLRLMACVGRTPLTEVHMAEGPDGRQRLVKVLLGCNANDEGAARLSALQHPALAPVKVVRTPRGGLSLIALPPGRTLRDRFRECLAAGLPGIPRPELIGFLRGAATSLDSLYQRDAIAHLGLNPRNLLPVEGRPQIADFGLAQLLWLPGRQAVAQHNFSYSAPELFRRQAGPACDQYSLALIYHEMLTGALPAFAEGTGPDGTGAPVSVSDLDRLPEADRPALARALAPDPFRRWANCAEMVRALEGGAVAGDGPPGGGPPADGGAALQVRFGSSLPPEQIMARLDGFCREWKGDVLRADADEFLCRLPMPRSFWQRWTGAGPGLEVCFRLPGKRPAVRPAAGVEVEIRPHGCGQRQASDLLRAISPRLVESVRKVLQVTPHSRAHERLTWRHPLLVRSVHPDGTFGAPIECQGKDLSPDGIGFFLSGELPTAQLALQLPQTPQTPGGTVSARVVRVQACGQDWFEVGGVLLRSGSA